MLPEFDWIIVGGGSAGCVLANRLSEDRAVRVLLLEAGRDTALGLEPMLKSRYPGYAYFAAANTWTGLSVLGGATGSNNPDQRPRFAYAQARLLGGGSSINGIGANRGSPADYDEWVEHGATGWGWEDVLPTFKALEQSSVEDQDYHGHHGLLPIRSVPPSDISRFVTEAASVIAKRGVPRHADQNGLWQDGLFPTALNIDAKGQRVSIADAYLDTKVRSRDNLVLRTETSVARLLFEGQRAVGVELVDGTVLHARRIALSAGALHTPALLMRSGLGDPALLQAMHLPVVAERRGIGQNLMEHPYAGVMAHLPRASRLPLDAYHIPQVWRFSSGHGACPAGDMHLAMIGRSAWHAIGQRLGMMGVWVNKSYSRGHVSLASPHASVHPTVDFRLLSDPRDLIRLADAFRSAAKLMLDLAERGVCGAPMPARMSDRGRRYGQATLKNRLATEAFGTLADWTGRLGPRLFDRSVDSGIGLQHLLSDETELHAFLNSSATGVWHASGTCRMGRSDDPLAVTDARGNVMGVEGLHIADASVFPTIPCANINIPTVMVAERMSALWRDQSGA